MQLAACAGAHVVATVRDEARHADVARIGQSCGSVEVVTPGGFVEHGPYDVVLEVVGAPNIPGDLDALAIGGRIAVIGVGAGARPR